VVAVALPKRVVRLVLEKMEVLVVVVLHIQALAVQQQQVKVTQAALVVQYLDLRYTEVEVAVALHKLELAETLLVTVVVE
tara:strand:- start:143 stop:382 length:240 start_codon:yes stop_codon:yes gene_type:complete